MENLIYAVIVITVAAFIMFLIKSACKKKYLAKKDYAATKELLPDERDNLDSDKANIVLTLLSPHQIEEKNLQEITDATAISKLSALIPSLNGIRRNLRAYKNLHSFHKTELLKADIPFNQLSPSRSQQGAVRALTHSNKGIAKQANFTLYNAKEGLKAVRRAVNWSTIIEVGSLVIGQFYLPKIHSKLESIEETVEKISEFLEKEFKSKIISVIAQTEGISRFSSEIFASDELRKNKQHLLDRLKDKTCDLIGHTNLSIIDITSKHPNPDYKSYSAQVKQLNILIMYQEILTPVLEEISKLSYLFAKGSSSLEHCFFEYDKFLSDSKQIRSDLSDWHNRQVESLRIDISKDRMPKTGLEAAIWLIPSLIDENYKYKLLKPSFVQEINKQRQHDDENLKAFKRVYEENLQIIVKGDKYYYLLE